MRIDENHYKMSSSFNTLKAIFESKSAKHLEPKKNQQNEIYNGQNIISKDQNKIKNTQTNQKKTQNLDEEKPPENDKKKLNIEYFPKNLEDYIAKA